MCEDFICSEGYLDDLEPSPFSEEPWYVVNAPKCPTCHERGIFIGLGLYEMRCGCPALPRIQDQPPPRQDNPNPPVADMVMADFAAFKGPVAKEVIEDIKERKAVGLARYGTALKPFDGRNSFVDLYQEILDALNYFKKLAYEIEATDEPSTEKNLRLGEVYADYRDLLHITLNLRSAFSPR